MDILRDEPRQFFLTAMRFFFGAWLLYVGITKWVLFGPQGFVGHIVGEFDATWSPHILNVILAWLILIAEPVLAALLLIGNRPRLIWSLISLLMFLLVIGQTMLMKPDVIANWQYLVLTLICAAWSEKEY